mmetsp:Transcript_11364/g.21817  ORF Transcript_11364/g.21817 Transcript_11364/m.21817 type:complete len:229 (-) Transcript_11364:102-788(-)
MLIGTPGSGKSTFRNALLALNECPWMAKTWHVVSQDESGSRRTCEDTIGRLCKDSKNKVILDRCNPDPSDRKKWLGLAFRPSDAAAIHFATDTNVCVERIRARTGHATIKENTKIEKLIRIVRGFSKKLVPPTKKEGFKAVHTVHNPSEAASLLMSWGCDPASVQFMIDAHYHASETTAGGPSNSADRKAAAAAAAARARLLRGPAGAWRWGGRGCCCWCVRWCRLRC